MLCRNAEIETVQLIDISALTAIY